MAQTKTKPNWEQVPPRDWEERQAHRIGTEVRRLRGKRSAQSISQRTAELGCEVSRAVISDLEVGRRRYVTVTELVVLALALETAPVALMYPHPYWEEIEAWPTKALPPVPKVWAAQWFSGLIRTTEPIPFTDQLFSMPITEALNYDANLKALERARRAVRLDKMKHEKVKELQRARHYLKTGEIEVPDGLVDELEADIADLQDQIDQLRQLGDRDLNAEAMDRLLGGRDGG